MMAACPEHRGKWHEEGRRGESRREGIQGQLLMKKDSEDKGKGKAVRKIDSPTQRTDREVMETEPVRQ